jgi:hypothetical protein
LVRGRHAGSGDAEAWRAIDGAFFVETCLGDTAVLRLKVLLEVFKQQQRMDAGMTIVIRKMDICLQHAFLGPGVERNMRVRQENRAGYAVRFELEKGIAENAQLQVVANAQTQALKGVGMAQCRGGAPAVPPFGTQMGSIAEARMPISAFSQRGVEPMRPGQEIYQYTCSPRLSFHSCSTRLASTSERGLTLIRMAPSRMPDS